MDWIFIALSFLLFALMLGLAAFSQKLEPRLEVKP